MTSSLIQPVFGYLADRATRRWLLPWAVLLAATGISLAGIVPSYWALLGVVVVSGLGVAAYHPEGYRTANQVAGDRKATGSLALLDRREHRDRPRPARRHLPGAALRPALAPSGLLGPGLLVAALLGDRAAGRSSRRRPAARRRAPAREGGRADARGDGAPHRGRHRAVVDPARPRDVRALPLRRRPWPGSARRGLAALPVPRRGRRGHARGRPDRRPVGRPGATSSRAFSCPSRSSPSSSGAPAAGSPRSRWRRPVSCSSSSFSITVALGQAYLPRSLGMAAGLIVGLAIGTGGIGVTILGWVADHWGLFAGAPPGGGPAARRARRRALPARAAPLRYHWSLVPEGRGSREATLSGTPPARRSPGPPSP